MENNKIENEAPKKNLKQSILELLRFALIAFVIVAPIRILIMEPFIVSGSSMFPTFENSDYLIIDKISYRLEEPKRNEVVIFRYPLDTGKFFIKRIIGLPKETIDIKNGLVTIKNEENKEGFILAQNYVQNKSNDEKHFELGEGEYFVMGDNRTGSSDSRYWGAVKRDLIVGRAFLRLLPINHINLLPGADLER